MHCCFHEVAATLVAPAILLESLIVLCKLLQAIHLLTDDMQPRVASPGASAAAAAAAG